MHSVNLLISTAHRLLAHDDRIVWLLNGTKLLFCNSYANAYENNTEVKWAKSSDLYTILYKYTPLSQLFVNMLYPTAYKFVNFILDYCVCLIAYSLAQAKQVSYEYCAIIHFYPVITASILVPVPTKNYTSCIKQKKDQKIKIKNNSSPDLCLTLLFISHNELVWNQCAFVIETSRSHQET